ncbi:hypothetical protein SAY86_014606 [Trapa natans]|uniref:Uncharacterized protein n=1 Tax=Trapa natans TaxID=22666 RepID=A0AAN7KNW7_TRANT|nr:hypothetical protein SAY86_014606 [Trapa natans]
MGESEEMGVQAVVCPKPRRLCLLSPSTTEPIRPFLWPVNHYSMSGDSGAGSELLDIIFTKGSCGDERSSTLIATSPPLFCGSPPVRAPNPVIQDAQFGTEAVLPFSLDVSFSSPSSAWKGNGQARTKFPYRPAGLRIEGFDCLSLDRGNCSISTKA